MYLAELKHSGFRNLEPAVFEPCTGLNLIAGPNGAGKSALLEAVHMLATGRSFRSARPNGAITWGAGALSVKGRWCACARNSRQLQVTLAVQGSEMRLQIGARKVGRVELMRSVPVVFIGAESLRFFEDGPSYRRQQLDWGAFHVEHAYLDAWRRYRQALTQRNSLLRDSRGLTARLLEPWEQAMSLHAATIHAARSRFFGELKAHFDELAAGLALSVGGDLALCYRKGWDPQTDLASQLAASRAKDARLGYSTRGPHRDDLSVTMSGRQALNGLSRGQQKAYMITFLLAASAVLAQRLEYHPMVLLDDLASELDAAHQAAVLSHLHRIGAPVLVTAVAFEPRVHEGLGAKVFHVEQGRIVR